MRLHTGSKKHNERCDLVHSLVSVREFKNMYGVDDREDSLVEFLLVSSTYAIEEYCMRRLLRKRIKERFEASGYLTLREYPVREVLAVSIVDTGGAYSPLYYDLSPEAGVLVNAVHTLELPHGDKGMNQITAFIVFHTASMGLVFMERNL